jgi:predicted MFS family arabinose efflux permease
VVAVLALRAMPRLTGHIQKERPALRLTTLLSDETVRLALLMNAVVMMTAFLVIPNIAAHLQRNLGFPRSGLETLYMVGGVASFLFMRVAGRAIDRRGPAPVAAVATLLLIAVLYLGFIAPGPIGGAAVTVLFVSFMVAMSVRNVSMSSLSTRVPRMDQRAGYMSLQSTAQHMASATGAIVSSRLLHDRPDGRLAGIPTVAWFSVVLAMALPLLLAVIGRRVATREATAS